jgi:carbonic anhydrase
MLADPKTRHRMLVELNVVEQCLNLYKTAVVQRKRQEALKLKQEGKLSYVYPRIHAMVFDPGVGILNKLPISFKRQLIEFGHIYNLVGDDE